VLLTVAYEIGERARTFFADFVFLGEGLISDASEPGASISGLRVAGFHVR
jgi:hypothetical protein